MGSAVLESGRCANIHELCFQAAKRSDMDCVEGQGGLFADSKEWDLMLRNFQIIQYHPARGWIYSCSGKTFSGCETLKYGLCCTEMKVIC